MSTIVLTGASGGIGKELVRRLQSEGHTVVPTDITTGSECRRLDVRSEEDWSQVLSDVQTSYGPIDVLINNAGVATAGDFCSIDISEIDRHFAINVQGAALGMRLVLPKMIERGAGHIINIGSLAAVAPTPGIALYSSTKFALRGLTLALATELAGTGVTLSLVNPDIVDTPMIAAQREQPQAAISFSSETLLDASELAEIIVAKALVRRDLEIFVPRLRGGLALLSSTFPRFGQALAPHLRRKGERAQKGLRDSAT